MEQPYLSKDFEDYAIKPYVFEQPYLPGFREHFLGTSEVVESSRKKGILEEANPTDNPRKRFLEKQFQI